MNEASPPLLTRGSASMHAGNTGSNSQDMFHLNQPDNELGEIKDGMFARGRRHHLKLENLRAAVGTIYLSLLCPQ